MAKQGEEEEDLQEQVLQEVLENIDHTDYGVPEIYRNDSEATLKAANSVEESLQDESDFTRLMRSPELSKPSYSSIVVRQRCKNAVTERVQQRSPPVTVARNVHVSCSEKVAELFPSDSDLSSCGMVAQSRSSGSTFSSRPSSFSRPSSLSRPSSMHSISGYSDHQNMSGVGSAASSVSLPSHELAVEQAYKNSSRIDNIQKGTSKRAVRMYHLTARLQERMDSLEGSHQKMGDEFGSKLEEIKQQVSKVSRWMDKEGEYSALQDKAAPCAPTSPPLQSIALSWLVPYNDLKGHSVPSILSSRLQLPWAQDFKARLYLEGIGKGQGNYLSIAFTWAKTVQTPKGSENYPINISVQVINQSDSSETIEKKLHSVSLQGDMSSFKAENLHPTITKLIPISTVEDISLGYLINGLLIINITVEYIP